MERTAMEEVLRTLREWEKGNPMLRIVFAPGDASGKMSDETLNSIAWFLYLASQGTDWQMNMGEASGEETDETDETPPKQFRIDLEKVGALATSLESATWGQSNQPGLRTVHARVFDTADLNAFQEHVLPGLEAIAIVSVKKPGAPPDPD